MRQPAGNDEPSAPNGTDRRPTLAARIWPMVFALLCVALSLADIFHLGKVEVKPIAIALLVLGTAPWSLPWFASLVTSLKVGDVTLDFRELKQELKQQQAIVGSIAELGVGGASGRPEVQGMVSHATSAAPDRGSGASSGSSANPPVPNSDFRSRPVMAGRKLSAEVTPYSGSTSVFLIHATVVSTDPSRPLLDGTPVTFGLPTFAISEVEKAVKSGVATLDCLTRSLFMLSAEVEDVTLVLDLAKHVPYRPN